MYIRKIMSHTCNASHAHVGEHLINSAPWARVAEAMVRHTSDAAILERGLVFADTDSRLGRQQLADLGLEVLARCAGAAGDGGGREVAVDLLSVVCARGYGECGLALLANVSAETVGLLRDAGRLEQALRVAVCTGNEEMVESLMAHMLPALPARGTHTTPQCLLDSSHATAWAAGVGRRLAKGGEGVIVAGLRAGRWNVVLQVLMFWWYFRVACMYACIHVCLVVCRTYV